MKDFILDRFQRETKEFKDEYFCGIFIFCAIILLPVILICIFAFVKITPSIRRLVFGCILCVLIGVFVGFTIVLLRRSLTVYRRDLRLREEIVTLENLRNDNEGIINRYYMSQCIATALEYYPKSLVDYPGIPVATFMSLVDDDSRYDVIWHELADRGLKSDHVTVFNSFRDFALVFRVKNYKTVEVAFLMIPAGDYFVREINIDNLFELDKAISSLAPPKEGEEIFHTDLPLERLHEIFY